MLHGSSGTFQVPDPHLRVSLIQPYVYILGCLVQGTLLSQSLSLFRSILKSRGGDL